MATGGQLRKKKGPIKQRLEETQLAADQALQQKIPEENLAAYLFQIKALKDKLQSRFLAFRQVEEELEKIAETNEEQAKKLSDRDEYLILFCLLIHKRHCPNLICY